MTTYIPEHEQNAETLFDRSSRWEWEAYQNEQRGRKPRADDCRKEAVRLFNMAVDLSYSQ